MRFLIDANLSPLLAEALREAGHDVAHVRDLGLTKASDAELLAHAEADVRVVVSADTDFGTLLAQEPRTAPSVILLRRSQGRRALVQAQLILSNLEAIADDLDVGSIVVFTEDRIRVRRLPISPV